MLICIPEVLSKADVADFRRVMDASDWEDGRSTAGAQSALVKRNEQLPPDSEVARKLGNRIISALTTNPRFLSAAIQPLRRLRQPSFRHSCRQRRARRPSHGLAYPHRFVRDAVPGRAGRI